MDPHQGPSLLWPPSPEGVESVGVEMELQLVEPAASRLLVDGILPLMEACDDHRHIKAEFIQNTVEVVSEPAADLDALERGMRPLLRNLLATCGTLGMAICGAGTHPFDRRPAIFTPGPRYAGMEKAAGWLGHNQVTFATHIHLGVPDREEMLTLMGEVKPYLPLLIAISANSPFWHGTDTRFAAFRQRVLAATRSYGPPPDFAAWNEFERFLEAMIRMRMVKTIRDLHWDLRPRPDFGTLEIRVMDAQSTLSDVLALAALLRALARFLRGTRGVDEEARPLQPLPWWYLKDNCYCASRYGMDALISSPRGELVALRQVARTLLERLEPLATEDERLHLQNLERTLAGHLPYQRQLQLFQRTGSMPAVVRALTEDLRREID